MGCRQGLDPGVVGPVDSVFGEGGRVVVGRVGARSLLPDGDALRLPGTLTILDIDRQL